VKGETAEHWAAHFLQQQGLKLITQNYRCRLGEIDLILRDGETLVFVEVRQRSSADYGGAAASIDRHKQHRLILAANYYLMKLSHMPPCRFDVMLMDDDKGLHVEWLKNAFDA